MYDVPNSFGPYNSGACRYEELASRPSARPLLDGKATAWSPYTMERPTLRSLHIRAVAQGATMRAHRFGRKITLPSTAAIKHQLLMLMLEDEIRATPSSGFFEASKSPALAMLRRLKGPPLRGGVG